MYLCPFINHQKIGKHDSSGAPESAHVRGEDTEGERKMKAIVYESHAGHTRAYAKLIGEKTGLPVYSVQEAKGKLDKGTEVLFLGWLMAGIVKGFKKAKKQYQVKAVCAVGMGNHTQAAAEKTARQNGMGNLPVFLIRGGLDMEKLSPIYRMMMNKLLSVLEKKKEKTAEIQGLIDVAKSKDDLPVTEEAAAHVLAYLKK